MLRWILPESIEDMLPAEAGRVEGLRRRLLDLFRSHGYQLVAPPLLEYVDSLLTGSGRDLGLRTFTLVDQLSGRMMGVRADITPQVARIDAHLLNRRGVTRLCYCGSVLHTLPASLTATREPLQLGAELYGHAGLEADIEIVRLLARALEATDVSASRIDVSHVGLFRALAALGGIGTELEEELFGVLQAKDVPTLKERVATLPAQVREAMLALPDLYGGAEVIERAAGLLPDTPRIRAALDDLRSLARALPEQPLSFDLADLRGYHYHSGLVFAAYAARHPAAVAFGGRYDDMGKAFGRGRPATGFSMDLREIARLKGNGSGAGAVLAPRDGGADLEEAVARLQAAGEMVMRELPGHDGTWQEAGCDRRLVLRDGHWVVVPFRGE